jgi:hypothetical protein
MNLIELDEGQEGGGLGHDGGVGALAKEVLQHPRLVQPRARALRADAAAAVQRLELGVGPHHRLQIAQRVPPLPGPTGTEKGETTGC